MRIISTNLTDNKDKYAAINASKSMKDYVGNTLTVTGYMIYEDLNDRGEDSVFTSVRTAEGGFFSSISPTVRQNIESACEIFGEPTDESPLNIIPEKMKSKNDRDFLQLIIL